MCYGKNDVRMITCRRDIFYNILWTEIGWCISKPRIIFYPQNRFSIHRIEFLSTELPYNIFPLYFIHKIFVINLSWPWMTPEIRKRNCRTQNLFLSTSFIFIHNTEFLSTESCGKIHKHNVNWKNSIAGNKNPQGACDESRVSWHSQIGETWISGP